MSNKKSGFRYEVHPTPIKGKDGRYIVYARPARKQKFSIRGLDEYCARHYSTREGELEFVLNQFLKVAAEVMAKGYRIDTPIGSFVPRLRLKREITNADDVMDSDVMLNGVDYNPGKHWDKAIEKWLDDGFLREDNPNVQELVKDEKHLERALNACLRKGHVTVTDFSLTASLSKYTARKVLDGWTEGEHPRLTRSKINNTFIYTKI